MNSTLLLDESVVFGVSASFKVFSKFFLFFPQSFKVERGQTTHHDSTHIILFPTQYNGPINNDRKNDLHTLTWVLTCIVYILVTVSRSTVQCIMGLGSSYMAKNDISQFRYQFYSRWYSQLAVSEHCVTTQITLKCFLHKSTWPSNVSEWCQMSFMLAQITGNLIVCSTTCSG